ncbi:hypothetical protein BKA80DRAFT_254102 [Phyllosticta citrichinensis]
MSDPSPSSALVHLAHPRPPRFGLCPRTPSLICPRRTENAALDYLLCFFHLPIKQLRAKVPLSNISFAGYRIRQHQGELAGAISITLDSSGCFPTYGLTSG